MNTWVARLSALWISKIGEGIRYKNQGTPVNAMDTYLTLKTGKLYLQVISELIIPVNAAADLFIFIVSFIISENKVSISQKLTCYIVYFGLLQLSLL